MKPSETISAAIRAANTQGRPAIVAYLTAGFPEPAKFIELLTAVVASADVVEVGVPFTDPMADGLTIQRSSRVALEKGVTLKWILQQLRQFAARRLAAAKADLAGSNAGADAGAKAAAAEHAVPILLMSYLNPLLAYGFERLATDAADAGITGFIVPDLPFEESTDLHAALDAKGLALVQMVTPVTPPERLRKLCAGAKGFIYAVTMTGTTGKSISGQESSGAAHEGAAHAGAAQSASTGARVADSVATGVHEQIPRGVLDYMDRVRAVSPIPVCAGFGIRTSQQVRSIAPHVDGVVVGSALVEVLEKRDDPAAFLNRLRP